MIKIFVCADNPLEFAEGVDVRHDEEYLFVLDSSQEKIAGFRQYSILGWTRG